MQFTHTDKKNCLTYGLFIAFKWPEVCNVLLSLNIAYVYSVAGVFQDRFIWTQGIS